MEKAALDAGLEHPLHDVADQPLIRHAGGNDGRHLFFLFSLSLSFSTEGEEGKGKEAKAEGEEGEKRNQGTLLPLIYRGNSGDHPS